VGIVVDERARAAVNRRRSRGKDARLVLRVQRLSPKTGFPDAAVIGWTRVEPPPELVEWHARDVKFFVEPRLARYAEVRDLVISAWRIGPWERIVLADPYLMLRVAEWEYTHAKTLHSAPARLTVQSQIESAKHLPAVDPPHSPRDLHRR
jgi:hypothetical protein